ncbi:hypothetical protein EDD37DRAFT_177569 [Exophiala viscosa]|uniref:uncharacterized protein n=1 Tax=Exophiala viscosa TaxID=2486360 RepID=UPI0021A17265|nr:hypothetical protein EDD37DRAFT_177569 [Exophiala viscosa]
MSMTQATELVSKVELPSRPKKCSALGLLDSQPCHSDAISLNGLFCQFHSRQCHGLYVGYKRRNAELDALPNSLPAYLADSPKKLANEDFAELSDQKELEEIHEHLLKRHNLLDRVIKARKIHHSHFYALTMDYGHEKFLSSLVTQKLTVLKALERVVQRMAEVMYQQRKWFEWARECQDEEDKQRENEQKKIKREAALFRRQAKGLHRRMREAKAEEDARRQEQFLEKAYQERLAAEAGQESWDPLEDVVEYERGSHVHLIKHFLWMDDQHTNGEEVDCAETAERPADSVSVPEAPADTQMSTSTNESTPKPTDAAPESQNGRRKKKKGKGKKSEELPSTDLGNGITASSESERQIAPNAKPVVVSTGDRHQRPEDEPDMAETESRQEMRSRLLQGTKVAGGRLIFVAMDGTKRILERMPPMSQSEVDRLTMEITEIKNYLLCRMLLRTAVLLPAAMEANSLQEFFESPELKAQDLRDLCLKLEQPSLQDIRDACADYFRTDEGPDAEDPASESEADEEDSEADNDVVAAPPGSRRRKHHLPKVWQSKRKVAMRSEMSEDQNQMVDLFEEMNRSGEEQGTRINFGTLDDAGNLRKSKMRVKICGRYIYNYPSKGSLSRGGWLQFSILARNCSLYKAAELCKSWDEFYELNLLAHYFYFPNPEWFSGVAENFVQRSYIQMGFVPFDIFQDAELLNFNRKGRTSAGRRVHASIEVRNWICAQMKRNDPVSRRFIQYASMRALEIMILVRDGRTGRIIVQPPEKELWLERRRGGYGRSARAEWDTIKYVGPDFFEEMEKYRSFRLGFDDYYEIYIWSSNPGGQGQELHSHVLKVLHKAHRISQPLDCWANAAPVLKTITYDGDSFRVRDVREDETTTTIWDDMTSDPSAFQFMTPDGDVSREVPKHLLYTKADMLEDKILFPEEACTISTRRRYKGVENELTQYEHGSLREFAMKFFVRDGDTDEEESDGWEDELSVWESEDDSMASDDDHTDSTRTIEDDTSLTPEQSTSSGSKDLNGHGPLAIRAQTKKSSGDILRGISPNLATAVDILDSFGPGPERNVDMDKEFMTCMDLYKSKIFKEAWHNSDLEPGAQQRWHEYLEIRRDAETPDLKEYDEILVPCARLLKFLDYHPNTHRRVMKDMKRAYGIVSLFFSAGATFFASTNGLKHEASKIFDQTHRCKQLPDRRSSRSSRYREDSFFQDLDNATRRYRLPEDYAANDLPLEWDICIRPKIAEFFRHGVICVSYVEEPEICGRAFAAQEHDRPQDLYFDFRPAIDGMKMPKGFVDPYSITVRSLRQDATAFVEKFPLARFSLLRVWSSPHFYPFMLSYEKRVMTSFVDMLGRSWEWKFIPKDMPYSEWSVHYNMTQRFEPYMSHFGDGKKIRIRKDVVLVMAESESDLLQLTAAATFIMQTQPWRLEVDFWKSFVNVDRQFLDGLVDEWWL